MRSIRAVAFLSAVALAACSSPQPAPPAPARAVPSSPRPAGRAAAPGVRIVSVRECQGTLIDSAVMPVGVAAQFKASRNPNGDEVLVIEEAGCLVFDVEVSITRTKRVWAVHEVLERFADGGERVVKVVDPPGSPCPFPECDPGFDLAKLPADCSRERVGSSVEQLSPADVPIKLRYQVIKTNPEKFDARTMWQEPGSKEIVLPTQELGVAQSIEKIKFCHNDLEKLFGRDRFPCWLVVRIEPVSGGPATVIFSQNPLTRDAVERALEQIEGASPARRDP